MKIKTLSIVLINYFDFNYVHSDLFELSMSLYNKYNFNLNVK